MNDSILQKIGNTNDIDEVKRIAAALLGLLAAQQELKLKQSQDLHKKCIYDMQLLDQTLEDLP